VIRRGFGVASRRWRIFLQGGGACESPQECAKRAASKSDRRLVTSALETEPPDTLVDVASLSDDATINPDFYDATVVHVHYCSSDAWSGTKLSSSPDMTDVTRGWHFLGREIVAAVIDDLRLRQGLSDATEVVLAGGSAGGFGTFTNAMAVRSRLPSSVRFLAQPDAGFAIRDAGFDPRAPDGVSSDPVHPAYASSLQALELWQARGDDACEARSSTPEQRVQCAMGSHILAPSAQYTIPFFVSQGLTDQVQVFQAGLDVRGREPTAVERAYLAWFAEQSRRALSALGPTAAVYARDTSEHGIVQSKNFNTEFSMATPDGARVMMSARKALGEWYRRPCDGPVLRYVE
jgi:hypothetical protein